MKGLPNGEMGVTAIDARRSPIGCDALRARTLADAVRERQLSLRHVSARAPLEGGRRLC